MARLRLIFLKQFQPAISTRHYETITSAPALVSSMRTQNGTPRFLGKWRPLSQSPLTKKPGVNVIKVLHLYFTRVAIVSLAENNSCTCKLQV